jgi:hypothetical protein
MNRKHTRTGVLMTLIAGMSAGAFFVGRAFAGGAPTKGAVIYSGTLEDVNGTRLSGERPIEIKLWSAASGGANALCTTNSQKLTLTAGRFSITLPDACVESIRTYPDLWAEVLVEGASLGRTKLGAVPYALEADRASGAVGSLAQQVVPAGAVMPFDLAACPPGWSEFAPARSRTIIGVGPGLTRGSAVGSDSLTLSLSQLPAHRHTGTTGEASRMTWRNVNQPGTLTEPNHWMGWAGGDHTHFENDPNWPGAHHTHSFTTDPAGGGQPLDNRQASLPLLYCKKN